MTRSFHFSFDQTWECQLNTPSELVILLSTYTRVIFYYFILFNNYLYNVSSHVCRHEGLTGLI